MKRQGEVEAEYHAAHSYIQKLQDEISHVLDGILITESTPCSPTPSQNRNPPPPSETIPAPAPSIPNPHTPYPTSRTREVRAEDVTNIVDIAGRKPLLEDVTNIQHAEHKTRTASEHHHPSGPRHLSRSFDAELYWTGRKISVEDTRPRPQKEEIHHNLTFGRRRRTSLGEYGERYGGTSTLGRRVASLSGHRRSSLGDYQGDCRDSTKFDWARHRQSPRELKTKQVNVIREEHGNGTLGKTCKKSSRGRKDQGFVSSTSYSSEGAPCVTSKDASSLKHSAELRKDAEEGRTSSEVGKASNFSPPDPKDPNNTAEICRRVRELRNSIAESIEKQRQYDSDVQESISSPPNLQQVEPPAPCEKQAAPRDQTSALCLKTKEAEESSNKTSAGTVVSTQGSNKASTKVASSLCCVSKQEKGGEDKADRDHTDHHSAEEEQGWYRHYDVTDIPLDPQIKAVSPGADSVGWPAVERTAQNRPTTLKLPVSHGELLPHPPADSRQDVFQSDGPWPMRGGRRSEVLQSVSETTESSQEEESPKAVPNFPSAAEESSVNAADRTGRFQLTPIANEDESASSEASGDDSDGDRSSCVDVRDIEQQGPTVDLQDAAVDDDTEGVKGSELQGYTTDLRDLDLRGHTDDVEDTDLQDDVSDARDTEPQGHSSGVSDTEPRDGSEEPVDLQASDKTTNLVKEPQLWGYTAHLRDTESQDDAHDLRDSGSQVVDESDAEVPEKSAERWLRQRSGDKDHKNLQSTVSPPMTVCEQAVQLPLPQHDQSNDPTSPPLHHALSHPLPCSAGGPGAEPPQGAALDPLSQRPHHDTLGHHDLTDLSAHRPLSERENDQQASSRVLSLPADGETPGVDLPKAVVGEGDSEASTSASETPAGCSSGPSRTDQESERTEKDEGSCPSSHKQKDPTQCLVDSLPHNHQLPAVQCRDAEVQTMSDSALNPAHFLPHVDTACQTSPVDCVLFAGSPREDLAMNRSADVSTQQPEVMEMPSTNPESADHVNHQEDVGNIGFSDSSLLESKTTAYASSHVGDQQNGKQAAHFGTSHEVKRADVFSESKKRPSGKSAAKSHKQKNGGKLLTEHLTAKALVNKSYDNQCKQSKSRRGDESQSKQSAQNQRDSHSGHTNKDRKRTDQRHQAETNSKPSEKTTVKRTPSSEKTGKENFSFLPDEEPEMQVMVNSLTPVLQRRKSARRSNSHTGVSSSDDVTPGCEDLQNMLASFTAPSPPQERHKPRVSEQKTPGSSLASSKLSSQQPDRDEASSHRTSHLFIKPKFARTWHGPVQAGHGRAAAPKMGVAMMTSDPSSLTLGASARAAGGQGYNTHVHTMPVISRTLLDALHKRYCGYQYTSGSWVPTLPFPPLTADVRSLKPTLLNHPSVPVPGVPVQKLNSEGESDSGSLGTSSESSPRTGQAHAVPTAGPMSSSSGAAAAAPSSSAASSLQKHNGQTKKEEIEAVEACQWLRAAGFPQYAQMFEDGLFPVDISDVQRDHDFLDSDSIQSVIRRLNILNTCSVMKIDAQPCKKAPEESDEEDQCALSSNWEYQKAVRRWSRKLEPELSVTEDLNLEPSVSHDSLLGEDSGSHTDESPVLESKMPHSTSEREPGPESVRIQMDTEPPESIVEGSNQQDTHVSSFPISPKLRRAASERLKSALKKMESFKKKSKKYPANRNIVEISDPVVSDQEGMQAKLERLNCVDISPGGGSATPTPHLPPPPQESTPMDKGAKGVTSPDSSYVSPLSPISPAPPAPVIDKTVDSSTSSQADASSLSEYYTAHSQLLASFQACSDANRRPVPPGARKSSDSSLLEIFLLPQDHKPGSFPRLLKNGYIDTTAPFQVPPNQTSSTSSLSHGGRAPAVGPTSLRSRVSVYDNLSPGSPQHTFSPSGHRKPEDIPEALSSANRQSQVLRSFSVSSSGTQGSKMDLDMSSFAGMVRSQSASAATSLEHEVVSRRRGSDGVGREVLAGEVHGERKLSEGIEELDAMLQILLKDISSLSSGYSMEEVDSQDVLAANSAGATSQREVSFSISDHNGSFVTHSNTASVKEDGQLSQTSTLEGLAPSQSFTSAVDDSMEAEEGDMSSQDSSEEVEGSADETLERIIMEAHERRDSGVGSSLTRASRERTRKKMRWESFQKCHRPSRASRELQIGGLSVCQLLPLRQLSLLKLTSIMEKCSPTNRSQWSWSVPRFMKRHKAPQFSDKNVFGVPFTVMLQRTGQPLPQCVLYAMRYLRKTSHDAIGIFRKSGVRSRIQKLRDMVEACPDTVNFDELQPYDVADLLKQYFRELPECLLTNKLSDTFRSIFSHVPLAQRLEALQTAVVLLPEENREVLHCLLLFLGDIAEHADKHQMNASNLAVCFAPSLFNFMGSHGTNSPKRQRKGLGVPEQRELLEQKAVHECFTYMIIECKKLFMVPPSMYSRLHLSTLSNMEPVHLDEFYAKGKQPGPDYKAFGEEHIQILLKEAHDKNRGWAPVSVSVSGIEVLQRKPQDGHPMRQWKCSVEIEAPPIEVLNRILHERHKWDDDMLSWNVVERLDKHCDVFHYALNSMAPHPPRHFMVIRYWRPDLVKGACAMVSRSVEHSGWKGASESDYDQGVRAVELGSYYLMEPCGSGRSRLTYIARTDMRGRCPEWYNRVFGHLSANYLDRLRDSFRQEAEGPETKV